MGTTTAAPAAFLAALRTGAAEPPAADAPAWLWQLATVLHGELPAPAADAWATRLHGLLGTARLPAGLRPVHVWQADSVLPLLAGTADTAAPTALHRAAARGAPPDRTVAAARETFALMEDGLRRAVIDHLLECDLQQDAFRRLVR